MNFNWITRGRESKHFTGVLIIEGNKLEIDLFVDPLGRDVFLRCALMLMRHEACHKCVFLRQKFNSLLQFECLILDTFLHFCFQVQSWKKLEAEAQPQYIFYNPRWPQKDSLTVMFSRWRITSVNRQLKVYKLLSLHLHACHFDFRVPLENSIWLFSIDATPSCPTSWTQQTSLEKFSFRV